jgi:hypothetical protein
MQLSQVRVRVEVLKHHCADRNAGRFLRHQSSLSHITSTAKSPSPQTAQRAISASRRYTRGWLSGTLDSRPVLTLSHMHANITNT